MNLLVLKRGTSPPLFTLSLEVNSPSGGIVTHVLSIRTRLFLACRSCVGSVQETASHRAPALSCLPFLRHG